MGINRDHHLETSEEVLKEPLKEALEEALEMLEMVTLMRSRQIFSAKLNRSTGDHCAFDQKIIFHFRVARILKLWNALVTGFRNVFLQFQTLLRFQIET